MSKNLFKINRKKAFSLLELSIVMIIIGLLASIVVGSSYLVKKARLSTARTATKTSPVFIIDDLSLWLEATSTKAFAVEQPEEDAQVLLWKDQHPLARAKNATATTGPAYKSDEINGLPALLFDGVNDHFLANNVRSLADLTTGGYTAFVVAKFPPTISDSAIIAWNSASGGDTSVYLTAAADGEITRYATPGNALVVDEDLRGSSNILTFQVDEAADEIKAYRNGILKVTAGILATPQAGDTFAIGMEYDVAVPTDFFDGSIGEIILYRRTLPDNEREKIEKYLSDKWKIKLD